MFALCEPAHIMQCRNFAKIILCKVQILRRENWSFGNFNFLQPHNLFQRIYTYYLYIILKIFKYILLSIYLYLYTCRTLEGLVDKGVKVDIGIPHELWDKPSAEITQVHILAVFWLFFYYFLAIFLLFLAILLVWLSLNYNP